MGVGEGVLNAGFAGSIQGHLAETFQGSKANMGHHMAKATSIPMSLLVSYLLLIKSPGFNEGSHSYDFYLILVTSPRPHL